jgi:hypothetical protein
MQTPKKEVSNANPKNSPESRKANDDKGASLFKRQKTQKRAKRALMQTTQNPKRRVRMRVYYNISKPQKES